MWWPKIFITIPVVPSRVIELIDELMEDVIEIALLAPTILIEPTIDVVDNSMVNHA